MADFTAVLRKTLDGMEDPAPDVRAKVYERARATIQKQIDAMATPPPQSAVLRQFEKLDAAIVEVEASYPQATSKVEENDLDHLFEEMTAASRPPPKPEPQPDPKPDVAEEPDEPDPAEAILSQPVEPALGQAPDSPPDNKAVSDDPLEAFLAEQDAATDGHADDIDLAPDSDFRLGAGGAPEDSDDEIRNDERRPSMRMDAPVDQPRRSMALVWGLVGLLILGGAGYAGYRNQDRIVALFGGGDPVEIQTTEGGVPVRSVQSKTVTVEDTETAPQETTDVAAASTETDAGATLIEDGPEKFTQRLTDNGQEVDEGPATQQGTVDGEGTSVAGQSPGDETPPDATPDAGTEQAATDTESQALPVGQRAIFYQERTGSQAGTAESGAVVWSVVKESPGGDAPVEPAIRAEASVPELGLTMELTIRRNGDETFPASHVIELLFRVPDTFDGRGIADVQRITFKNTEQDPGNALIGVAAPLDTNIFMIALTDADTATETNLGLMRRQEWIDIPMQYVSGRRALITLEKGIPGEQVFDEVFAAWDGTPLN